MPNLAILYLAELFVPFDFVFIFIIESLYTSSIIVYNVYYSVILESYLALLSKKVLASSSRNLGKFIKATSLPIFQSLLITHEEPAYL